VGSLKASLGHLESASALSQITKVLLQFRHHTIAPTVNCQPPNPLLGAIDGLVEIVARPTSWNVAGEPGAEPLRALVNVFGATGSTGHAVLEEARPRASSVTRRREVIVPLSAASESQLFELGSRLRAYLESEESSQLDIGDVAYTLATGRVAMRERVAFVVDSVAALIEQLAAYLSGESTGGAFYRGAAQRNSPAAPGAPDGGIRQVAAAWVQGNVAQCAAEEKGRRVPLPSYPFARVRHWIRDSTAPARDAVAVEAAAVEPAARSGLEIGSDRLRLDPAVTLNNDRGNVLGGSR